MDATGSTAGQDLGDADAARPIAAPSATTTPAGLLTAWLRRPPPLGALALALYLAVFIAGFGLPVASHLNVPDLRQYWTDPQFYTWSMRWWPYAVSHWTNPLFSSQIGAPQGYELAWASTTPSVDLLMWPATAAFGVLVSYNLVLLLVPPLSAWVAFLAARRLTGRFWASLLAGAVYGLSPFELTHNWQGQPNLTVIMLFPLLVYLVLRWWDGTLGRTGFVAWVAVVMAVQFYTFNEAFAEMTLAGAVIGVTGFAVAGPLARPRVARLARLTAVAYAGAVVLSAPYLIYALLHYQDALSRQRPTFSLQFARLIVPASRQLFGLTPLVGYSNRLGRDGLDEYLGIPLLAVLLLLAVFAWSDRVTRLLAFGFLLVLALGAGPRLVLSPHLTVPLPWAGLWRLPIARSAEPSRFIVFGLLILALALARWLAAPAAGRRETGARWCLGLLAVAVMITDSPQSYQAVSPIAAGYRPPANVRLVNPLPAFLTEGLYRQYLSPGEIVVVLTERGNAGMLFQADANFYFRIAGGYINASLTSTSALPGPVARVVHPSVAADRAFAAYLRAAGVGAILVEQSWAGPWTQSLSELGMHGTAAGGVTVYPVTPWLAGTGR